MVICAVLVMTGTGLDRVGQSVLHCEAFQLSGEGSWYLYRATYVERFQKKGEVCVRG